MSDIGRARIIALSDARPTTAFEKIAEQIVVRVAHHNGGLMCTTTLFDVLKYPNAFCVTDGLHAVNEPTNAPTWDGEKFVLGPFAR